MTTRIFGSGIRRREDPRLITGQAAYTDDIKLTGMVHAAILRSPHAHARITGINTDAAKAAPGVRAVYTGADIGRRAQPHTLRMGDSRIRPEGRGLSRHRLRGGTLRGRRRGRGGGGEPLPGGGRPGTHRGELRAVAGHHQPRGGPGRRRAPAARGRPQQPGVPLGSGRRRHRRRLCRRRRHGQRKPSTSRS